MTSEIEAAARQTQSGTISKSLFAYGIFYGGMVCIAGVLGNKQVALGPLAVEAGLPAAHDMDPARLGAFDTIMQGTPRIWLGGILAYGVSTLLNVTIFSRLRGKGPAGGGGAILWLRSAVASVLSQIVDTLIFIGIAFYGVFPIAELLMGQMLAKVVLSLLLVPPLVQLMVSLGRRLDWTR
jgi:uncharacterized PurR-regulated membrane protein YhhQ (DUF165 family)